MHVSCFIFTLIIGFTLFLCLLLTAKHAFVYQELRKDWLSILMIVTSARSSINIRHLEKATVSTGKEGLLSEGNSAYNWSRFCLLPWKLWLQIKFLHDILQSWSHFCLSRDLKVISSKCTCGVDRNFALELDYWCLGEWRSFLM